MIKAFIAGLTTLIVVSAFWTDYYARTEQRNQNLQKQIEEQYQNNYDLRKEMNRMSKERQRLIMEIIGLKRRIPIE